MRRWNRWSRRRRVASGLCDARARRDRVASSWAGDERGSAALEFIAVGVLMLVPLAYLVIALATVQAQTLGIEAAARFAARTVASGADPAAVARTIAEQYDIDPARIDVSIACTPVPQPCPAAGATVVLSVRTEVQLPFLPEVFGLDALTSVPIEASAAHKVSRYGDGG